MKRALLIAAISLFGLMVLRTVCDDAVSTISEPSSAPSGGEPATQSTPQERAAPTPAPTGMQIGSWKLLRTLDSGTYSSIALQAESVRGDSALLWISCFPQEGRNIAVFFEQPFITTAGEHEVRVSIGNSFESQTWKLSPDRHVFVQRGVSDHATLLYDLKGAQEFQFVADLEIDPERWTSFDVVGFKEAEHQISPCDAGKATVVSIASPTTGSASPSSQLPALGVDRRSVTQQFMETFEAPLIAFAFKDSPLPDGTPRMLGQSPQGALIELIRPTHNLTKASIKVDLDHDETVNTINGYAMVLLVFSITSWQDAANWLTEATLQVYDERVVTTRYDGYNIHFELFERAQELFLQITR